MEENILHYIVATLDSQAADEDGVYCARETPVQQLEGIVISQRRAANDLLDSELRSQKR